MDTDAHGSGGSGFICVHPCSSVVILLSALTRSLIAVGSSAWSGEFGVYEPFDAEQGAAANPAFAFEFCHESQVCPASGRPGRWIVRPLDVLWRFDDDNITDHGSLQTVSGFLPVTGVG